MRRRLIIPLLIAATLIAAVAVLPRTPQGRGWLLGRAVSSVADLGYRLTFTDHAGNPWRGLELMGVQLEGPGVDLQVDRLGIGYFLPALVTGALPLDLLLVSLSGRLELDALAPAGGGGGGPIRLQLRTLDLDGVALEVDGAAYTLPQFGIDDLNTAVAADGVLEVAGTVVGPEGSAPFSGTVSLAPLALDLQVRGADLALARHWWDGVRAGTLHADVTLSNGRIEAEGRVTGAAVELLNSTFSDLAGPLRFRDLEVEANLEGQGFGGPVAVDGTVDIAARRWQANYRGTPNFDAAAAWLAPQATDALTTLGVTADLEVRGSVSGWTEVQTTGEIIAEGTLLDEPFGAAPLSFRYSSVQGFEVSGAVDWAGGRLSASLRDDGDGLEVLASAESLGLELAGVPLRGGGDIRVRPRAGAVEAAFSGSVTATLDRQLSLAIDGSLDADGWQAFLSGSDDRGATLEGAVVFADERVDGGASFAGVTLPGLPTALGFDLSAAGTVDDISFEVDLLSPGTLALERAGLTTRLDPRGSLRGRLTRGAPISLEGDLGPLAFAASYEPVARSLSAEYALRRSEITLPASTGVPSVRLSVPSGNLSWQPGAWQHRASVVTEALSWGSVALPRLRGDLDQRSGAPWTYTGAEGGLSATLTADLQRLSLRFETLALTVATRQLALSGTAAVTPAAALTGLEADLEASSGGLALSARVRGAEVELDGELPVGFALGPLTLAQPLRLDGDVDLNTLRVAARLAAADTRLDLRGGLAQGGSLAGELTTAASRAQVAVDLRDLAWSFDGDLDLSALSLFGFEAAGTLSGLVSGRGVDASGELDGALSAPVAAAIELRATDGDVLLGAAAAWSGIPIEIRGTLWPAQLLQAEIGDYGTVDLQGDLLAGNGTIPALQLGPLGYAGDSWQLQGSLSGASAQVLAGRSRLELAWAQGWRIDAQLDADAGIGDLPLTLQATGTLSSELPRGSIEGTADVASLGSASFAGSLDEITVTTEVITATAATLAGIQGVVPTGTVFVDGTVTPLGGPSYAFGGDWIGEGFALEVAIEGAAGSLTGTARGDGVELAFEAGALGPAFDASFDGVSLEMFLVDPPATAVATGSLALDRSQGWRGDLALELSRPLSVEVRLRGVDGALLSEAAWQQGAISVRAGGRLLPNLDLVADAELLDGSVRVNATATGTLATPTVEGTLNTAARSFADLLDVPAIESRLRLDPAGPAVLVEGGGLVATVDLERVDGTLDLGVRIAGTPHLAAVVISGSPRDPRLDLALTGPLLSGTMRLSGDEVAADLGIDPELIATLVPAALPAGLEIGPTALIASSDLQGSWQAHIEAAAGYRGIDARVSAALSGDGLGYGGRVVVAAGGDDPSISAVLVAGQLEGEGGAARLSVDLATVDVDALAAAAGLPLQGSAIGRAELDTAPPALRLDGSISGALSGTPFVLAGSAASGGELSLTASVMGIEARAEGRPDELAVAVTAPELQLEGTLTITEALQLALTGTAYDRPFRVAGRYDAQRALGSAEGSALGMEFAATAEGLASAPLIRADLRGEELPLIGAGAAALTLRRDGSRWTVDVAATSDTAPLLRELTLAGELLPELGLQGAAVLDRPYGTVSLEVVSRGGPLGTLTVTGRQGGLRSEVQLRPGFDVASVDLIGGGVIPVAGVILDLSDTALRWQPDLGFSGGARVVASAQGFDIAAALTGDGPLVADVTAQRDGLRADGMVEFSQRPWADRSLAGKLNVEADASLAGDITIPPSLALTGSAQLAGSWSDPSLDGEVRLFGPVPANGSWHYRNLSGSVRLMGEGLELSLAADRSGVRGDLAVSGFSLSELAPWLTDPTLDAQATFAGDWRGALRAVLPSVALTAGSSSARGQATVQIGEGLPSYSAVVRLALDLADLQLGTQLRGRARGPVALSGSGTDLGSATLSGLLALDGLGSIGPQDGAALSGTVQLSGDVADPRVGLDLVGEGSASGQLRGEVLPRSRRATLDSDLAFGPVVSDLRVSWDADRIDAAGTLAYNDLRLRVSGDQQRFTLAGEGRLAGARGNIDVATLSAHLEADLAQLVTGATGLALVTLRVPDDAADVPLLAGTVSEASVAGIVLGDLDVTWPTVAGPIAVSGSAVTVGLDPRGDLSWRATLTDLELRPGIVVSAEGSGRGLAGSVTGSAGGSIDGRPLRLAFSGDREAALRFAVAGEALGGSIDIDATLDPSSGWGGTVAVTGARLSGQRLDLRGSVTGPGADPHLSLQADVDGAVSATAAVEASLESISLSGRAAVPTVADPIFVSGSLWPAPAVTLALAPGGNGLGVAADALATDSQLRFSGALTTEIGGQRLSLRGSDGAVVATLAPEGLLGLQGIVLRSDPVSGSLRSVVDDLAQSGLGVTGAEGTSGRLTLYPFAMAVDADGFGYRNDDLVVRLDGRAELTGQTHLTGSITLAAGAVPGGLVGRLELPFIVSGDEGSWSLAIEGTRGRVLAELQQDSRTATLRGRLDLSGGAIEADLALADRFATGRILIDGVRLTGVPGLAGFSLSGSIDALGEQLVSHFDVDDLAGRGGVDVELTYPVADLFAGVPPLASLAGDARIRTFDVASLPPVAVLAPFLTGEVSGVAQLRQARIVGRLVAPDLAVLDTPLPTDIEFNGGLGGVEVRGSVEGSALTGTLSASAASALFRFERFPLQVLAEAVAGATDISAELSGVARVELPFGDLAAADVRVATELIRLERGGVVTSGNATFSYFGGALTVESIAFEGAGRWQASGVVRNDRLEFTATADEADFGPLLGLVPALAQLEAGARGSLELVASGSLRQPDVLLTSDALELALAGSTYLLEAAEVSLVGNTLTADAQVIGLSPIVGRLAVTGAGTLSLAPLSLREATFELDGSATVPVLGVVTDLVGSVEARGGQPRLTASGRVGNPFTLEGSLLPLDLRLVGNGLAVQAPSLLLASSVMDADISLRYTAGLEIGGAVTASEARFQLGIRPAAAAGGSRGSSSALERILFADLRIEAPGRIFFNESFAAIEARADLRLGGSAAAPQLSGSATAVRGSIRFSGREFTIDRGIANFEPSRGAYPQIDLVASTSFDKGRVIPAGTQVRFAEPRGSSRFDVRLGFQGALEARRGGGFSLDFDPDLSSNARIEVAGESLLTAGPRPLTQSELLALVTLGRLDISSILTGEGGLVTAVAQGALDTAVDLLVLAELQNALSEALGVEVVEIRTTALSSLLDSDIDDPFGVSLRLGGYLSEELFASYQIGSFNDEESAFALTNEVRLTYALGPVEIDLAGGVNFAADDTLAPIPALSTSVRYGVSDLLGIEAGIDLSSTRSQLRVGVTFRW